MSLHPLHLADLKASGLSDKTIDAMQVYSLPPIRLSGFTVSTQVESALAFPYFTIDGKKTNFMRIKVFPPIVDHGKRPIKYLQKKKSTPRLYILPPIVENLKSIDEPLYIIEGEKKTAKAVEKGMTAIGIGGIWNWIKKREIISDFADINIWKRSVIIVPDSDAWIDGKEQILRGAYYLGRELFTRGAQVQILKLEGGDGHNDETGGAERRNTEDRP